MPCEIKIIIFCTNILTIFHLKKLTFFHWIFQKIFNIIYISFTDNHTNRYGIWVLIISIPLSYRSAIIQTGRADDVVRMDPHTVFLLLPTLWPKWLHLRILSSRHSDTCVRHTYPIRVGYKVIHLCILQKHLCILQKQVQDTDVRYMSCTSASQMFPLKTFSGIEVSAVGVGLSTLLSRSGSSRNSRL